MFIIWNDGEKWNIDDSLTFTISGTIYSSIITVNNIMYVYAIINGRSMIIYYDNANNKWVLRVLS